MIARLLAAFAIFPISLLAQDTVASQTLPDTPLHDSRSASTPGWQESDWFGSFNSQHLPWIHHRDHGWLMLGEDSSLETLYFNDPVMGWLYTDPEVYPKAYSFTRSSWLLYLKDSASPRKFYDYSPESWLDFESEVQPIPRSINDFRFTHATIPTTEIFHGGPPRDGIPAILNPEFVSLAQADDEYMEDEDLLLSFTVDGITRAYPYRILNWHEVVNDRIGDVAFAVTYCPLCGTGVVFDRTINGVERTFGVSGLLYLDNVLMYDHQSESLWSQLLLKSVTGPMFRTRLEWLEGVRMTWKAWKERFPEGEVLSTDTNTGALRDYSVDPYTWIESRNGTLFPVGDIRDDLAIKAWVYGLLVDDVAIALPRDLLPDGEPVEFDFEGKTLRFTFEESNNSIDVVDMVTGEPIQGLWSFWFSWQAFYRDTAVWGP